MPRHDTGAGQSPMRHDEFEGSVATRAPDSLRDLGGLHFRPMRTNINGCNKEMSVLIIVAWESTSHRLDQGKQVRQKALIRA